jgi:hypothetical protein
MVWPGIGGFNEWLQSSNPVTKSTVTGFKGKTHSGLSVIDQPCKKHNTNIYKKTPKAGKRFVLLMSLIYNI